MNEIPVLRFAEDCYRLSDDGFPSITELPIERLPEEEKQMVISYLRNSEFRNHEIVLLHPPLIDPFNGLEMNAFCRYHSDGKWEWFDDLAIYAKERDIKLPEEFLEDVFAAY